eukprot:1162017-Pelagomonas_calceolata.AAC.5
MHGVLKESGVVFIEYQPLAHPVFEGPGASNGCTGPAAAGLELYHGSSPLRLHESAPAHAALLVSEYPLPIVCSYRAFCRSYDLCPEPFARQQMNT